MEQSHNRWERIPRPNPKFKEYIYNIYIYTYTHEKWPLAPKSKREKMSSKHFLSFMGLSLRISPHKCSCSLGRWKQSCCFSEKSCCKLAGHLVHLATVVCAGVCWVSSLCFLALKKNCHKFGSSSTSGTSRLDQGWCKQQLATSLAHHKDSVFCKDLLVFFKRLFFSLVDLQQYLTTPAWNSETDEA